MVGGKGMGEVPRTARGTKVAEKKEITLARD